MSAPKQGLCVRSLSLFLVSTLLLALTVVGFDFLFSPYRSLPIDGIIDGNRYTWGHLVRNNRYGFRERNFKTPKPLDTYRVMVLGDSLTWGTGLAVEERYPAIAEKLLTEAFPQKNFELLNFGLPGAPTTKEAEILRTFQQEVSPDLIVVSFCLNDPQPERMDESIERKALRNSLPGQVVTQISQLLADLGLLYTGKLLNDAFDRVAQRFRLIPSWTAALARVYEPSSSEWQSFVQALKDIKMISDELKLPPPIFAVLNQGDGHSKVSKIWARWFRQAEEAARDIGFVTYNHESEITGRLGNQSRIINKLDGHPSASVNRIYGEKLYQIISEQLARQPMGATPGLAHGLVTGRRSMWS